ncbi:YcxB family protein [Oscillospiraceae bacterium 38-13]
MEFEIRLDYTIEDFADFWYGFVRKKPGRPLSASDDPPAWARALGCFFCWFFIVMGIVSVVNSLVQGRSMYEEKLGFLMNLFLTTPLGGVLEIAFGALGLRALRQASAGYLLHPPYARWVRRMWKKYQETGPLYSCRFTGDGCWVHDSKSDHRFDYACLNRLWEDGGHFYLELQGKPQRIYILPKRSFTEGTAGDFPAFWTERTGKQVLPATPERRQGWNSFFG